MKEILADTRLMDRPEFVSELVDLFYRASSSKTYIMFEDLTTYLIEHEIESSKPLERSNFEYYESKIMDQTTHNNYIGKIYYFDVLDKMILYEQNNRTMRLYDGRTMKLKRDIVCSGVILAIEFITMKKMIAVLLSNRKIYFYDSTTTNYKIFRELEVPCTQRCLCYVQDKNVLFSGGTNGAIFGWDLTLIFSNEFLDSEVKRKEEKSNFDYRKYLAYNTPWFEPENILCMVDLPKINFLATGSCDNKIRLWDLRTTGKSEKDEKANALKGLDNMKIDTSGKATFKSTRTGRKKRASNFNKKKSGQDVYENNDISFTTKEPSKELIGHKKAVREIAYSEKHKILVSCGFDFEVFVWNPYYAKYIIKLEGHEHPLVGVNIPKNLPCFITCDTNGMIKIWNISDYSCLQTFYVSNVNEVTCLQTIPEHRRLVCGSRVFKIFEYSKPFTPELSDDNPIICARYSSIRLEFYIAGERSIKIWSCKHGKPVRELKNIMDTDITYMTFDDQHRKLIVGDHNGAIKIFDLLSGIQISELESHEGEISYIGYGDTDRTVVTTSWDKVIKIHMDNKKERENPSDKVLRGKANCHTKDIIAADYSHNLGLIATGSRNHKVRLWEYEKVKYEDELKGHTNEITIVRFIPPFPLLITADNTGELFLWLTIPHKFGNKLLLKWRNMFTLQKMCPITSIDSYYDEKEKKLLIIVGDEMGYVRIQDVSQLLDGYDIEPINVVKTNHKRNPWRIFKLDKDKNKEVDTSENESDSEAKLEELERETKDAELEEGVFKQIAQWKAHRDSIKFIKYITETDYPVIFTAGMDKLAKGWNLKGEHLGTLRQGVMKVPDKPWEFPLQHHEDRREDRNDSVQHMLEEVKRKRNQDAQNRKLFARGTDKKKLDTARTVDRTMQPVVGYLDKTFQKELDYSTVSARMYGGDFIDSERDRGEDHSSKVKRLLETVKRMTRHNAMAGMDRDAIDEEEEKMNQRKIGPFQFDIDHDIDAEILNNQEVYDDIKDVDEKILKKDKNHSYMATKSLGRRKRKNR